MAARMYSERLGILDEYQFQAALERLDLGDFVRADPVSGGLFGQNVFVTSTTGAWVFRGMPHNDWQFPAERFYCEMLHSRTRTPVPWPYLIDTRDDIFGWSYAIMPRMPGLQHSDFATNSLTFKDRLEIAHAMAENLAHIHALTWSFAGSFQLASRTLAPVPVSWAEWVYTDIHHWLDLAREHSDRTTNADIHWVDELLYSAHQALAEPFQPGFVMHDYKEQNATFERTDDGWRVSGVFDLMEAFFGDSEIDLSRQTLQYMQEDRRLAHSFVRRYLERRPPRPGFEERFLVYLVWDRLVIWEFFQRSEQATPWQYDLTLREWLEPILATCDSARLLHEPEPS